MSDAPDAGSWPQQRPSQDASDAPDASRLYGPAGPDAPPPPAPGAPGAPAPAPGSGSAAPLAAPFGAPPGAPPGWAPGAPHGGPGAPGGPAVGPYGDPSAYPGGGAYKNYGYGYGYGYAGPAQTDKGARNALILAIVGIFLGLFICGVLFGPAAVVEGAKARKRIQLSNGRLVGDGMAIGGIVLGVAATALSALGIILLVLSASKTPTSRLR